MCALSEELKDHYKESLCQKHIYPWKQDQDTRVDFSKIYVPLTMDINIPGVKPLKQPVQNYLDLFKTDEKRTRFVLSGNPGQGKSSFCAKLAHDWSTGPALQHIRLLFILQLGAMNSASNIEDEILEQLNISDVKIEGNQLKEIIENLTSSVLVVLDSLDEASPDFMKETPPVGSVIKCLRYRYLKKCRLLVTTRPWRETDITNIEETRYTRLELKKMTSTDVKKFIHKFFHENEDAYLTIQLGKRFLEYIDKKKLTVDTSTPLMILLLCWYWVETEGKDGIPDRTAELYDRIISIMYDKRKEGKVNLAKVGK